MVAAGEDVCLRDFAGCLAHHYPASLSVRRTSPAPMFHALPRVRIVTLLMHANAGITDGSTRFNVLRARDRLPHCGGRVGPLVCVLAATTTTPAIFFYGASVRM